MAYHLHGMARRQTLVTLGLLLALLLSGCGKGELRYDAAVVARDLGEMLAQPADFQALYDRYRRTPDFRSFLKELRARGQGSVLRERDPQEILANALDLVRQSHLEEVLIRDPLLLAQYRADIFLALLALEGAGRIERFFAGLRELTGRASRGEEVRPEVIAGIKRALRALCLRQPFLGASPPYAPQTHEDRLGEIPKAVELAVRLLQGGWKISGFYEEGRAKVTRRFNHLQAVIDLVAEAPPTIAVEDRPVALFLQAEQALDGTDRDLKQVADRVEATANYILTGGWTEDFDLAAGSKAAVVLVAEEGGPMERLWREIERRASLLKGPIPILMIYGEGGFKMLNLTEPEAMEVVQALSYSSSS